MKPLIKKSVMLLALIGMISGCEVNPSASNSSFNSVSPNSSDTSTSSICEHDFAFDGDVSDAPTIIQSKGAKYVCSKCGQEKYENASYDLNEYEFADQTYMYDGNEHQLTIRGMIPFCCTVEYENNSLMCQLNQKKPTFL